MNWYKSDADTWKEIIETVAAEEHRSTQMVEKDTTSDFRSLSDVCEKLDEIKESKSDNW